MPNTTPRLPLVSLETVVRWLGGRKLELAIFLLGVALRVSMRFSYEPTAAHDFPWHWELVLRLKSNNRHAASTLPVYVHANGWPMTSFHRLVKASTIRSSALRPSTEAYRNTVRVSIPNQIST